ncbi:methyl-accepting chemotaxis protein [Vibrio neptunius]|uniref:Methyl-accepting chemotaxis protein n=1 Tax=Vibrio neptunius TaxID=170651 RepID=A0ABS3A345_9VIBR|nr:methyl-accepting chemotaxis protein [Vibrio neptunius]MBN3493629.1 methyl-accepting chemotaxis protein [Vibrio neptunius]MBN3516140.1 methyl-accepting chemotaxis protein [Vibrio neptunius]MBN3550396.1 methyl-accepting chemotaxis protein [Vibrio neptunius]MBN3578430.1 methyl-accepting chemotaxis protein [Vibrio neptunius]MCH9872094.1 methyl-accepting chemotaxis protein [Vibrio neptunius]
MLSRLTIAQKVYLLGFSQLLAMMIMGGFALYQMNKIGNELTDIAEEDIPLTKMLTLVTEHQLEQAILFERALVKAIRVEQGMAQKSVFEEAKKKVHDLTVKTEKELYDVEAFIEKAIPLLHSVEAKEKFKRLLGKLKAVEKSYSKLVGEVDKTMDYGSSGDIEEMLKFSKKVEAHEDEIDKALIAILDEVQNFTLASALQAEQDEKLAIKWMTVIASVSIVLGIIMPFLITRAIRTPILNLIDRLKQVAEGDGDLTIRLDDSSRDETGTVANAFNTFLGVLMGTITQINAKAEELGKSSEVAVSAMQRTLENVEKQRCDIEQVATAINQMNATTQEVANSTANASSVTDAVRKHVMEGQKEALATQEVIQELANEVTTSSGVIENLVSETNNIGQVLESIQGIAEQTNLLALNAAIEAARAGETGRGFAVVADEVRSLAQRTQEATVDIQKLVDTLQSEAKNAVSSMKKGTDTAKLCLEKSSESANTFSMAAESVNEIAGLNLQIAAAAEQQSTVAQDLDNNLTNIKSLAEETADETKSTAVASETIAKNVIDLHKNLNKFQV